MPKIVECFCERTNCFANREGLCDCLVKTRKNNSKCSFFKDKSKFKRTKNGFVYCEASLLCDRTSCFANCEGVCDCLSEAYPKDIQCPFYKDKAEFIRTIKGFDVSQK